MVNYACSINITLNDADVPPGFVETSRIDNTHFWMDYDEDACATISGDTVLRHTPNGVRFSLLSRLRFFNSHITYVAPFSIDNLSELMAYANDTSDVGDTIQLFVHMDNDAIRANIPIFSIIRRVE